MEELKDGYISENGKLVDHFLQAIHAAEKRQADLDAYVSNEQKKLLKGLSYKKSSFETCPLKPCKCALYL